MVALLRRKPQEGLPPKDQCAVADCENPAERHFARGKVEAALSETKLRTGRGSAGLCREHYRAFKKATKDDRKLDRAAW